MTTVKAIEHRAKITVPTTNGWKAKLTITKSLTRLPSGKTKAAD